MDRHRRRHAIIRLSFDSPRPPGPSARLRAARAFRLPLPLLRRASELAPARPSSPARAPRSLVWPGRGERQRERATLCPFSQFDGNAKARFRAFRGGSMGLAGRQGVARGRRRQGELVYGAARLEIDVHDIYFNTRGSLKSILCVLPFGWSFPVVFERF